MLKITLGNYRIYGDINIYIYMYYGDIMGIYGDIKWKLMRPYLSSIG
jgi:hypothetical protein